MVFATALTGDHKCDDGPPTATVGLFGPVGSVLKVAFSLEQKENGLLGGLEMCVRTTDVPKTSPVSVIEPAGESAPVLSMRPLTELSFELCSLFQVRSCIGCSVATLSLILHAGVLCSYQGWASWVTPQLIIGQVTTRLELGI